jgi:hypothetical protein
MDILLKSIGVLLLLTLWNKENVWILCNEDGPQSYSLPTGNSNAQKPKYSELSALFISEKNTTDQMKPNGDTVVSSTSITEKNGSHENIVHMEGGGGVTIYPDISHLPASSVPGRELLNSSSSFNDSFSVADHDNRSSSIVPRKGVTYSKSKIVARKGVVSGTEENSSIMSGSSMEGIDNTEKETDFLDKKCVCCSSNTSDVGTWNNIDSNCRPCCYLVKGGRSTLISVSTLSNVTEPVSLLPADSAALAVNLTSQGSTSQSTSHSVRLDKQKSTSVNSTAASTVPPARKKKPVFTLDAVNDLPVNSSSQSLSHAKDVSKTDYVIPVVLVIMAVPLVIVLALFLYKKGSEFWERRHYRRMDFLIDGMYNE